MANESTTELIDPRYADLDRQSVQELLLLMNLADQTVPSAVEREIPRITVAVEAITGVLQNGGRLFYLGAGTSGRLGVLDASECPPTFQVPPDLVQGIIAGGEKALSRATEASEDDPDAGVRDLQAAGFRPSDALVGIAASGRTPYVLGAVAWANALGALTAGISCTQNSDLSRLARYPMEPVPGPEVIAGSTRLRAGTATKLVLNMISTAVMIRLGHVYGNLMVNVRPSNQKLAARATRIISQIAEVDAGRAAELLATSGGNVRVAILIHKQALTRETAEQILASAGGNLRRALESTDRK